MTVTIRELEADHDAPEVLPILQQLHPEMDAQRYRRFMTQEHPFERHMVADHDGTVIGISELFRKATDPKNRANISIAVHPDYQRQGVGMMLFDDMEAAARAKIMRELRCRIPDDTDAPPYHFVKRLGFSEQQHSLRSELELEHLDDDRVREAVQAAEDTGIEFTTLADEGDSPENRQKVYRINKIASDNMPRTGPFMQFEAYENAMMSSSTHPPQGIYIAIEEKRWVGMSQVSLHIEEGYALNEMTDVLPTRDDKAVLYALKMLAARFARDQGFQLLRSETDSSDEMRQEVNQEMGYTALPGYYLMTKDIR